MNKMRNHLFFFTFVLIFAISLPAQAGENILIAAASNLRFAMDEICHAFKETHPSIHTKVSYGSSGNFFAQIKQGAPYDIFFSADAVYPALLEKEGLTAGGTRKTYAVGRIVLWVPEKSVIDLRNGIETVLAPIVNKLAIANPRHAPYGRAAEESLRFYGLWDKVKDKLIYGENISQTAQFVSTGAADAGIIALSLAISPRMLNNGKYWPIPVESHNDIEQAYVVLKNEENKQGIKFFLDFFHGKEGRRIFTQYGFLLP